MVPNCFRPLLTVVGSPDWVVKGGVWGPSAGPAGPTGVDGVRDRSPPELCVLDDALVSTGIE